ncbi:hypothetical protein J1N35_011009 [Gossypium stocksii]|uniref:Uncharacterized protein n=1 Tax=Gossypium stocksii TaxID=47602 RepID=A0A9D3W160_9ROSI|nr:hypothetical protein J1N35_011009 [Gossypium stocksii]
MSKEEFEQSDNSGNGKPRVGKKKPKRKRDKQKCFLCDGSYTLKNCLKKSVLKKKPGVKALGLGSSVRGVEAKEAKIEKKPVEWGLFEVLEQGGRETVGKVKLSAVNQEDSI